MAAEMVKVVTSGKLKDMDWTRSIEICERVSRDTGQMKDVIKAIKKRLGKSNASTQLFSVMLLEMLMNNCGEIVHKNVIENGLIPILVKIVKKKNDLPVRERIFLLLDATQTALGGASGKFPQYYDAYFDLVNSRVQFPVRSTDPIVNVTTHLVPSRDSPAENAIPNKIENKPNPVVSDPSILEKATGVLYILREVLDALDPKNPEGATGEFVLDLIEQCSFQKERIMQLVMASRDENVVKQGIELNEQLHKALVKHDSLLSVDPTSVKNARDIGNADLEDEEHLSRRLRKGKACMEDNPEASSFRSIPRDKLWRMRPLSINPVDAGGRPPSSIPSPTPFVRPPSANHTERDSTDMLPVSILLGKNMEKDPDARLPSLIPPPPSKHTERERFFKETQAEGSALPAHMNSLSLHSKAGDMSHGENGGYSDLRF